MTASTVHVAPAVDAERLRADFDALAAIGAAPGGGISRTTFSDAHFEARSWFLRRAAAAGLETRVDAAGNVSAVLHGTTPGGRTLLLGSHLDTVPNGGAFDGALGVLAALEVLRAVKDAGLSLRLTLEAIDFTDEDGTLLGLLGSRALAGTLTREDLRAPRGGRDELLAGLARAGLREERLFDARRDPVELAGYLELHIEQGPRLERERIQIGIVTAIAGSRSFRLRFEGASRHAGTTPMDIRRDALLGASRFVSAVREIVVRDFPACVATVGRLEVEPGAFNVVPGVARVALEFRGPRDEELDRLEHALLAAARADAHMSGLRLDIEPVGRWRAVELDPAMRRAILEVAERLGLSTIQLISGAGHDAESLAAVTRAGMIFVPSVGGISHDPAEHTNWEDCLGGARVLLATAIALAS